MYYITETDHLEDPRLQIYTKLSETQLYHCREPHKGLFIAESPKVIERALNAGCKPVSMLMDCQQMRGEGAEVLERIGAMEGNPIPVYTAEEAVLRNLTGFPLTRGCLCAMERRDLPSVEETVRGASRICIMEEVVNPTNVGAIFRSAAALGMEAVLLNSACADPYYRRASRVSMGTVFQIPWTYLENRRDYVRLLQSLGFKCAAMALRKDTVSIRDGRLRSEEKLAVILGAEGEGLKEETIDACDYTIKIPMAHGVDSLNVAACSAVAFWELSKQE